MAATASTMHAIVYHGPGQKAWEEVPKPTLTADTDAIVKVDTVTICGTDLHILKGDVAAVTDGRILGHEAVGVAPTFEQCTALIRPGGTVANVGVHGGPATLHLEELWIKNVTITTGLVDTYSTPTLLRLLATHQIDLARFVTHRFAMGDFLKAYDTFADAANTRALKVVLTA